MFEIEVRDTKIPIVSFIKTIADKLLHFLKHIGVIFLELFNPEKWSWPHWVFTIIFLTILVLMFLNSLAGGFKGIWIYKKSIFGFLITILIFTYLIIIIITYVHNVRIVTEYDFINKTLKHIMYFISLMLLGIIFSIILSPKGMGRIINPLIYIKDCIIVIFVLSFIVFSYNLLLLVLLE